MATQKRNVGTFLASLLTGVLIGGACAFGLVALENGGIGGLLDGGVLRQAGPTHEVTDSAGRTVAVPEDPQSIAALDSFAGTVCIMSGAGDRMMGVPNGVKSNELLAQVYPDIDSLSITAGNDANVEELLSQNVDVVFVRSDLYEGEQAEKLETMGIPYVVVDYGTVDEQIDAIRLVGEVCGGEAADKANKIADYYQDTVDLVEERTAQVPEDERRSVYHSINSALLTDGEGSLGSDWIERAGGISVSASEQGSNGSEDYNATLEQVYAWNPDVIVCNVAATADEILEDEQWAGMDAVEAGEVHAIPISMGRWGQRGDPETFFGMVWLGKTLYPDLYEDIDLRETVESYYQDFFGIDIDDETWDAILAGTLREQGTGSGDGSGSAGA